MATDTLEKKQRDLASDLLRLRPKSNYINEASLERLFILTEHWKSDMDFYNDELRFLKKLIGKYFIWLTRDSNISHVERLSEKLDSLQSEEKEIQNKIKKHFHEMEQLDENAFSHDEEAFRTAHSMLEDKVSEFIKNFRKVKAEIFKSTEHLIEEEQLQLLMDQSG